MALVFFLIVVGSLHFLPVLLCSLFSLATNYIFTFFPPLHLIQRKIANEEKVTFLLIKTLQLVVVEYFVQCDEKLCIGYFEKKER
jgi:hypothetical protein